MRQSGSFPLFTTSCVETTKTNVVGNAWKEIVDFLDFADNMEEAKTFFVNLKKRYQKKKAELRRQEKSGTCLAAVECLVHRIVFSPFSSVIPFPAISSKQENCYQIIFPCIIEFLQRPRSDRRQYFSYSQVPNHKYVEFL